jgi:hypothetical protein
MVYMQSKDMTPEVGVAKWYTGILLNTDNTPSAWMTACDV